MDDFEALLAAYADGELDHATALEVEAYIASHPAAQHTVSVHRETSGLLRAAFAERNYVRPGDPATFRKRWREVMPRHGWALAASVLMGLIGFGTGTNWPDLLVSGRDRMLTEVAEYHSVYSRETVHLVEVPAAQAEHLKLWLGKRVNRTLVIPDFSKSGLTFVGGRMVVLDGVPVAELMYTREKGLPIAFCVFSRSGTPATVTIQNRGAINLATWDDGSHMYVVVGEAEPAIVGDLAALAQKQL